MMPDDDGRDLLSIGNTPFNLFVPLKIISNKTINIECSIERMTAYFVAPRLSSFCTDGTPACCQDAKRSGGA